MGSGFRLLMGHLGGNSDSWFQAMLRQTSNQYMGNEEGLIQILIALLSPSHRMICDPDQLLSIASKQEALQAKRTCNVTRVVNDSACLMRVDQRSEG